MHDLRAIENKEPLIGFFVLTPESHINKKVILEFCPHSVLMFFTHMI